MYSLYGRKEGGRKGGEEPRDAKMLRGEFDRAVVVDCKARIGYVPWLAVGSRGSG